MHANKLFLSGAILTTLFASISSAYAQNAQVLAALNRFSNNNTQRETARAIAILCPASGRLNDRLQQDCNALVGAAFRDNQGVRGALAQLAADQTPLAANRAQLASAADVLSARSADFSGKIGGGLMANGPYTLGWNFAMSDAGFGPWAFFGTVEARNVDRDASDNQDGFNGDGYGITLGLDRRISDAGVIGAALRYRKNSQDYTGASGKLDQRDISGDVYFSLNGESPWYVNAIASIGRRSSDQVRNTNYGLDSTTAVAQQFFSDFDTDLSSAAFTVGYQIHSDAVNFDPYFQLEYARQKVDGYDERAANPSANGARAGRYASLISPAARPLVVLA
jgi:uncharacterized protein with beta-barrel porin domain